ncbi:hypothetical protein GCM10007907_00170 [Chitinimonas prasina]|uniref:Uncharacterized protein n=1 Tax=Chitinimonas prasina TaxID=1434937 RepID=A0ABQ5YA30_9NEIS|nr:hypothetical protein [Chitinimonas prasina]GLR11227.1 hypothetical protein GCM10007907_00170 [Chitinimonas prasina]
MKRLSFQEAHSIIEASYGVDSIGREEVERALDNFLVEASPVPGWDDFNDADISTSMGIETSGDVLIISWYSYCNDVAFLVGRDELPSMISGYVESYSDRLFNNGDVLFFLLNDKKVIFVHEEGVYAVVSDVDLRRAITAYRGRNS